MRRPGLTLPSAVIFDLDGTLVDSAPDIAAALNTALVRSGLSALDVGAVTRMVGAGAERLMARALDALEAPRRPGDVDALLEKFLVAYAEEPAARTVLYPGARETLYRFAALRVPLAVATNKPQSLTLDILERLAIRGHFGAVEGARAGIALKPAPDMLLSALRAVGREPRDALMVGDSAADVGAARAAGIKVAVVSHGYAQGPVASLGAAHVFSGFAELLDTLLPGPGPSSERV